MRISANGGNDRSIPETRTALQDFLASRGIISTGLYLLDNLGLSLSDCYWVRPSGAEMRWKDVNLFDNPFKAPLIIKSRRNLGRDSITSYALHSPDASTGGDLPKWWVISNGTRYLIKGNAGQTSQQSLNEVLATIIHTAQGYTGFVPYSLVGLPRKRLGCRCASFTSPAEEFISAWDLAGRRGYAKDEPFRSNYIKACAKGGHDEKEVIRFLDYMALTDFLICNTDRHMNNFGVLRDTSTLRFTRHAPIFDSGNSMMYETPDQISISASLREDIRGFSHTYKALIDHVSDKTLLDTSKLPLREEIEKLYSRDTILSPFAGKMASLVYERATILKDIQSGISLYDAAKRLSKEID